LSVVIVDVGVGVVVVVAVEVVLERGIYYEFNDFFV
jgi:hypothetical protein